MIAAFNLVQQAEEDLTVQAPTVFDGYQTDKPTAMIVFYPDAFPQEINPEARFQSNERLRITPFDDLIYLPMAKFLMKSTHMATLPDACEPPYPAPYPPLRWN